MIGTVLDKQESVWVGDSTTVNESAVALIVSDTKVTKHKRRSKAENVSLLNVPTRRRTERRLSTLSSVDQHFIHASFVHRCSRIIISLVERKLGKNVPLDGIEPFRSVLSHSNNPEWLCVNERIPLDEENIWRMLHSISQRNSFTSGLRSDGWHVVYGCHCCQRKLQEVKDNVAHDCRCVSHKS